MDDDDRDALVAMNVHQRHARESFVFSREGDEAMHRALRDVARDASAPVPGVRPTEVLTDRPTDDPRSSDVA